MEAYYIRVASNCFVLWQKQREKERTKKEKLLLNTKNDTKATVLNCKRLMRLHLRHCGFLRQFSNKAKDLDACGFFFSLMKIWILLFLFCCRHSFAHLHTFLHTKSFQINLLTKFLANKLEFPFSILFYSSFIHSSPFRFRFLLFHCSTRLTIMGDISK